MKGSQKKYDDDDGRVIVNMNVEGMRWHEKSLHAAESAQQKNTQGEQMTKSQARQYTWYSMLAALSIVAVFSITWILFTLFCTEIWFR